MSGSKAVLTAPRDNVLAFSGAWAQAYKGDSVSTESMLNRESYFMDGLIGQGMTEMNSVTVSTGKSNYFKFILQDADQCFEYEDGTRTTMPDCYCGWVEYKVAKDGTITVLSSAIDIDGDSIVVGAGTVPEPSGGLLVLLGCAGLLLRRRGREVA